MDSPGLAFGSSLGIASLVMLGSIVVVAGGAHFMVDAAVRLAKRMGISELVIGLTIIAIGTSSPELAVTLIAAARDQADVSVGNVVGSNIFNLGFILGGCALFGAIPTSLVLLRRDGGMLVLASVVLFAVLGLDLELGRLDGVLLLTLLLGYVAVLFWQRRDETPDAEAAAADGEATTVQAANTVPTWRRVSFDVGVLLAGLALMLAGSRLLVSTATSVATGLGVSEWVIGVTIVAAGTSVPELATSLVAAIKRSYGLSAGSLIGSDIFNILGVLGVAGALHPMRIDVAGQASLLAMIGMIGLLMVFLRTGWRLSRAEGVVLLLFAAARWAFDLSLAH